MNQELQNYINQELSRGISKEVIIENLQSQGGWSKNDLEIYFGKISKQPISYSKKITIFFWILAEIGLGLLVLKILFVAAPRGLDGLGAGLYTMFILLFLIPLSILGLVASIRLINKNQVHVLVVLLLVVSFFCSPFGNWILVKIAQKYAVNKEQQAKEPYTKADVLIKSMEGKAYKIISVSVGEDKSIFYNNNLLVTLDNNLKVRPAIQETSLVTEESFFQYIEYLNKNFIGKEVTFLKIKDPSHFSGGISICSLNENNITNSSSPFSIYGIDKSQKNAFGICGIPAVELFHEGKPVWQIFQEKINPELDKNQKYLSFDQKVNIQRESLYEVKRAKLDEGIKGQQKVVFIDEESAFLVLETGYIISAINPFQGQNQKERFISWVKQNLIDQYVTVELPKHSFGITSCEDQNLSNMEFVMKIRKKINMNEKLSGVCNGLNAKVFYLGKALDKKSY